MKSAMNRRQFLSTAAAAASASLLGAQTWSSPVLDIHLHSRADPASVLAHIEGSGVTKAVLLTRAADEENAKTAMARYPGRFQRFISADPARPDAIPISRKAIDGGALGFGEIKYHLALDSREMKNLYALAGELRVPVLIHFQEVGGEGGFDTGFTRLPAMLKAFPNTIFIGHADYFWANISADEPSGVGYPTTKVKPGGLTDRMLADYPNLYGDLSANSGRNSLARDPEFATGFLARHQSKLMFGSDCPCLDGKGKGQVSNSPLLKGRCVARETLTALGQLAAPDAFRKIVWENGMKLMRIPA
jgi:predicted TIM-barrel fold metal-dependent hydrolase